MDINNTTKIKSPGSGNGLASTRDAAPGDTLINITSPYLLVVEKEVLNRVCSQCLLDTRSADEKQLHLKKCGACNIPYYCSAACQKVHWKFIHKKECPVFKKLPQCPPTPVRAVMQILWRHPYGSSPDPLWKDLESHASELKTDQKRWEDVCLQAKAAAEFTDGPVMDLLLTIEILCRMVTNAFRATLSDDTNVALCFEPTLALANHSCSPNAVVEFDRRSVSLRALNPIKTGEQIFISYIDITQSKSTRQKALLSRYFFTCKCPACISNETPYHTFLRNPPTTGGRIELFLPSSVLTSTAQSAITTLADPSISTALKKALFQATDWLKFSKSKNPIRGRRFHDLWNALDILSPLRTHSLFAIQPYSNILHEIYHYHLNLSSFLPALIIYLFISLNIDPYTYPQPPNPIRITSLLTISRLLKQFCEMELDPELVDPYFLMNYGPKTQKAFLDLDKIDAYQAICILVVDLAVKFKSGGRLVKEARLELQDAVEMNGNRHSSALSKRREGLNKWMNDEGNAQGKMDAEATFKALGGLGSVECLMEAVSGDWVPQAIEGPFNSVEVGREGEYTAE